MPSSIITRAATAVALGLLFVCCVVYGTRTPRPREDARTPLEEFAAERAMRHVRAIAKGPHPVGTIEHDAAGSYIYAQLDTLSHRAARGLLP